MQIAWPYPIGKHLNRSIDYTNRFLFGERDYIIGDVGLSSSIARPMKLR